jgi:signal transduction histidine kinase
LAELAGEQERALRRWVSDAGARLPEGTETDLVPVLRSRASDRVSVSLPANPVLLDPAVATEVEAAVTNALDNVVAHAGAGARAFVLLEDLEDSVVISVRDDGVGIAAGRLQEAVEEGRVGISKSIVGRLNWMGGTARLSTEPGRGTEWELTIPRSP